EAVFNAHVADTGEGPFLRTGDLGFMEMGELFVVGRLKDIIILRGANHHPQDLELTVENCHDSLRAAGGAAFSIEGLAEERLVIVQEVQSREVLDPVDVTLAIRRALVECHEVQPYVVVLVEPWSIPRTTSGKIRRRDCRKAFLEGSLRVIHEWRDAKGV